MYNEYYVYMMANQRNTVLYIGVTNDLQRRVYEHKHGIIEGFTKKYHVEKLVYFESTSDVDEAIAREKQLKGWKRFRKEELISTINPEWNDLAKNW